MKIRRVVFAVCGLGYRRAELLTLDGTFDRLPGIRCAYVNPTTALAYVEYDPRAITAEELVAAIEQVGLQPGRFIAI
jgi:hypothetical protein